MSYGRYEEILNSGMKTIRKPVKISGRDDIFNHPDETELVNRIFDECNLHNLDAAAWLVCVNKKIHSPGMYIRPDNCFCLEEARAGLANSAGRENNINDHRFLNWVRHDISWNEFYRLTVEFLRLCKIKKICISQTSLFSIAQLSDDTLDRSEKRSFDFSQSATELFNARTVTEFNKYRHI